MIYYGKCVLLLLIIAMAAISLSSCTNCTCTQAKYWGLHFNNYNRTTDSFARVEVFPKNMDYGLVLFSSDEPVGLNGNMSYNFDFDYDYKITVHPSGKIYKLEQLYQEIKSKKSMGTDCVDMICAHSYKLNGVGVSSGEEKGTAGASYIPVN